MLASDVQKPRVSAQPFCEQPGGGTVEGLLVPAIASRVETRTLPAPCLRWLGPWGKWGGTAIETVLAEIAGGTVLALGTADAGGEAPWWPPGQLQEPPPSQERCACHAPAFAADANLAHPRATGRARSPRRPAHRPDGLGRCARDRGSTRAGDQRRSFRRWAMPAFWSSRLASLCFRKFECSIVE